MKTMALRLAPRVHRAAHRIAVYLYANRELRVTQGEAHILAHLIETGPATIGRLHRAFAHRRSTLTSILDRMAARGLIRREPSERDRRTFVVRLTRPGQKLARQVHAYLEELETRVLAKVTEAQARGFEAVLESFDQASR